MNISMQSPGSVTGWIERLQAGHSAAQRAVWERYFEELVRLAARRLGGAPRGAADEEDVALSALDSFYRAAQRGRFPDLADRGELWRLLLRITERKAVSRRRHESRQKRGGGEVRGESALGPAAESQAAGIALVADDRPTPDFAAAMAEEFQRLLEKLDGRDLRALALAKLEGFTNEEIAQRQDCSLSTVERRLRRIRQKWEAEVHDA